MYQSKSKHTTSTAILLASSTMFFTGVLNWSSLDWFPRMFNLGYGFKLPLPPTDSAIFDVLAHQADLAILCLIVVACVTVLLAAIAFQDIMGRNSSARSGWALLFFAELVGAGLALGYIVAPCVALIALASHAMAKQVGRFSGNPSVDGAGFLVGNVSLVAIPVFAAGYLIRNADQVAVLLPA